MRTSVVVPELVALAGGEFVLGRDDRRADERPAHAVTVEPFRAAVRPVSNAEYAAFVESTGREPAPFLEDARFSYPDAPVVGVSWFEAVDYCAWLSLQTGVRYRLPTEAEREYAAAGGLVRADWPWGDDEVDADPHRAALNRDDRPHVSTTACANDYGLQCMADNVHEWCSDWYDASAYARESAPMTGRRRSSRGGSWRHQVKFNRVAARSSLDPSFHYNDYGFRVYV